MISRLQCGARTLDLSAPVVMGVLNVTPDSFSDGGRFLGRGAALVQAQQMVAAGAAIIDIGGESTRPGAAVVSEQQELDRVMPVLEAVAARCDVIVSVDTSRAAVMKAAAQAGAGLINDVRALTADGALAAAVDAKLPVCLMHMQGKPPTMQQQPRYDDVVTEVIDYLLERASVAQQAGIPRQSIVLDPGFGFGKNDQQNLTLLYHLLALRDAGFAVLAGLSRKSMIGRLLGREVDQRLAGSIALALMAVERGARIIRAHDVAETVDALALWHKLQQAGLSVGAKE